MRVSDVSKINAGKAIHIKVMFSIFSAEPRQEKGPRCILPRYPEGYHAAFILSMAEQVTAL